MKTRPSYGVEDLLEAYLATVRDPPYGIQEFRRYHGLVLSAFCRCFGVSFRERQLSADERAALALLKRVLLQEARLPYPGKGALEAGGVYAPCRREFQNLLKKLRELAGFYRGVARELASGLWGELGERTHAQLVASGLDRAREPVIDFDEI